MAVKAAARRDADGDARRHNTARATETDIAVGLSCADPGQYISNYGQFTTFTLSVRKVILLQGVEVQSSTTHFLCSLRTTGPAQIAKRASRKKSHSSIKCQASPTPLCSARKGKVRTLRSHTARKKKKNNQHRLTRRQARKQSLSAESCTRSAPLFPPAPPARAPPRCRKTAQGPPTHGAAASPLDDRVRHDRLVATTPAKAQVAHLPATLLHAE